MTKLVYIVRYSGICIDADLLLSAWEMPAYSDECSSYNQMVTSSRLVRTIGQLGQRCIKGRHFVHRNAKRIRKLLRVWSQSWLASCSSWTCPRCSCPRDQWSTVSSTASGREGHTEEPNNPGTPVALASINGGGARTILHASHPQRQYCRTWFGQIIAITDRLAYSK